MTKEFVPYVQALALKELGFDEPCFFPYNKEGEICWNEKVFHNIQYQRYDFPIFDEKSIHYIGIKTPLYQQAFRWFREKHNLQHEIFYQDDLLKNGFKITDILSNTELTEFEFKNNYFELGGYTYEEAELACLIKLIEIVKTK